MNFKEILNKYLEKLNCTPKELSEESGLSQTVISRYRKGERTPIKNSEQITKLATAFFKIAEKNNNKKYTFDKILDELNSIIDNEDNFDYDTFSNNLNTLISSLDINTNEMAKYIVFDASHISRIRHGKSKPSNPVDFATKVCNFVFSRYKTPNDIKNLSIILDCSKSELTESTFYNTLFNWLTSATKPSKNQIADFLNNLNTFNLEDYIKAIKFDELKLPNIPFYKEKTRHYYGIEEMKQGELNFFKATVLSKSKENIFMCSDMPMEDMAEDVEFDKKWMFAIAMCLKKGLHLNIIHNLDRPFNEMMLGLESWIPIYMTGQVSPYYLKEVKNCVYHHFNYVSGTVALTGECIKGVHDKGMYYLTTNKKEVQYYKQKATLLLKKANSLMDIYKEENKNEFKIFLQKDEKELSDRKRILSSLPLFTISDESLLKILKRNEIVESDINNILQYKTEEKNYIQNILQKNKICDTIYEIKENEFIADTPSLPLNTIFYNKKITYTYEEYKTHLNETKDYTKKSNNYELHYSNYKTFKNITITILKDNYVILSKNANPTIHFVIRHPKLTDAIKKFNPLVKE